MPKHARTTPSAAAKRADDRAARAFLGQMGDVVALVGTGTPTREHEHEAEVECPGVAAENAYEAAWAERERLRAEMAACEARIEALEAERWTHIEFICRNQRPQLRLYRRAVVAALREQGISLAMLAWDAPMVREAFALGADPGVTADRMAVRSGL